MIIKGQVVKEAQTKSLDALWAPMFTNVFKGFQT